jgi:tetratricopeptide (TPR) repeat protein
MTVQEGPPPMLPINPKQIPALYAEALRLQGAGKIQEALQRYSVILGARRDIAEVHFQVGRIFQSGKRWAKAAEHLRTAASLKPGEPAIWQVYAETVLADSDDATAREFLAAARAAKAPAELIRQVNEKLNPTKAQSKASIGKARPQDLQALSGLLAAGKFAEAEKMGRALHAQFPKVAIVADMLAAAQVQLGALDEAETSLRAAIAADSRYAEAHNNLGRLLTMTGREEEAEAAIRKAISLMPGLALAHQNLGQLLMAQNRDEEATTHVRKALKLKKSSPDLYRMLGTLLVRQKDDPGATAAFETLVAMGQADADVHSALGQSLMAQDRIDAAREQLDIAIAMAPNEAIHHQRRGILLQRMGDFDAAEASLRTAMTLDPSNGNAGRLLATQKKFTLDDPMVVQMQAQFEAEETSDEDRRNFGFALSKVMEDNRKNDQVFRYLHSANRLMRKQFPYDIALRRREVDGIMRTFGAVDFQAQSIPGTTDYAPIFVTGMPRSGTTLVEQIIASHSRMTGAGEIGFAAREAYRVAVDEKTNEFRNWAQITPKTIAKLGHDYAAYMRGRFPDAVEVTDKSIQTYSFMGLIRLAMPKSKIVVVRRDPRDNLLSIYKNIFQEGTHLYAYDLADLGAYYRMFVEVIDFWRDRIPDWFHEVQYEDLIADPETEARKLIAACGLEWEEDCLNFHLNTRRVDTLSVYQVRQPIYASSMKAWQRYAGELGDMFEALDMTPEGEPKGASRGN